MEQDNVSYQIKKIRKENKLTQLQLAEMLGVTFQSVSKWENGKNMPDITLLNKISTEFKIDINILLNGEKSNVIAVENKQYIKLFLVILTIIIISFFCFCLSNLTNHENNMKLTQITTSASDFNISGSLVISNNNAIIHVSDIKYTGEKKDIVFKSLTFSLIEDYNNTLSKIDEHTISNNDLSFEKIVENISFVVEDYTSDCDTFNCNNMYIKVYAIDENDKTITFEIPFTSIENCSCEN
ncbi:MAG: helix-turn-helix transcriptional regulator [bacterium]